MTFDVFINFNGNCREAVALYSKVFGEEVQGMMTFGQMPVSPDFPLDEADKDKILFSSIKIGSNTVMFSDVPSGIPLVQGNNISPTIGSKDQNKIRRMFDMMKEDGGTVVMELQQTFWSDLYGTVTDKFGVSWQFSHDSGKQY